MRGDLRDFKPTLYLNPPSPPSCSNHLRWEPEGERGSGGGGGYHMYLGSAPTLSLHVSDAALSNCDLLSCRGLSFSPPSPLGQSAGTSHFLHTVDQIGHTADSQLSDTSSVCHITLSSARRHGAPIDEGCVQRRSCSSYRSPLNSFPQCAPQKEHRVARGRDEDDACSPLLQPQAVDLHRHHNPTTAEACIHK